MDCIITRDNIRSIKFNRIIIMRKIISFNQPVVTTTDAYTLTHIIHTRYRTAVGNYIILNIDERRPSSATTHSNERSVFGTASSTTGMQTVVGYVGVRNSRRDRNTWRTV